MYTCMCIFSHVCVLSLTVSNCLCIKQQPRSVASVQLSPVRESVISQHDQPVVTVPSPERDDNDSRDKQCRRSLFEVSSDVECHTAN